MNSSNFWNIYKIFAQKFKTILQNVLKINLIKNDLKILDNLTKFLKILKQFNKFLNFFCKQFKYKVF